MSWLSWFSNRSLTGPPTTDFTGLPGTYTKYPPEDGAERPDIFEPALKQFRMAFRSGEPAFREPEMRAMWLAARRAALGRMLRLVAQSRWKENLVLRGSVLLKSWLGDHAREPGDIDWVVVPASIRLQEFELFGELVRAVAEDRQTKAIEFLPGQIAIDDIWTYDRVPGRRIVIPWQTPYLPGGAVQMDFVFGERLPVGPQATTIACDDGEIVSVLAASKELSLAWKLVWLETDMHPQGKDLYDATLLAEQIHLPDDLLRTVFHEHGCKTKFISAAELPERWQIDWDSFRREYPDVHGDASIWQERLAAALDKRQFFSETR